MNKKLQLLLLATLCCLYSSNSWAQHLVVWQKNGPKVYYDLDEDPRTTFKNGLLTITTSKMSTDYQLSNILRYTFENITDAVSSPESPNFGFRQKGDDITITGVEKETQATMYDVSGLMITTQKSDGNNPLHFTLEGRKPGIYMIQLGDQTLKFLKR